MSGPRFNPDLLKVPIYIAGKSVEEVKEELGLDEVTKLASNESPVGPSPRALEAALEMLPQAHRYPGVTERDLRRKLSAGLHPDLTEENIILGNGGTDILRMIAQAFVFHGGNTVMSRVTFPMYHILTTSFGGEPRLVEPRSDYGHDLLAMAEVIDQDTRLVFLCSPNNPSGHIVTQAEVDTFLRRVPNHVVVAIDESYDDYVTDPEKADSLADVLAGRNVIVVRSFSKTAGLANLRVGYGIGPVSLINYLRHTQLPFQTGAIALAAAAASLDDHEYLHRNRQAAIEGRQHLYELLEALHLTYLPSQANFVCLVDPPLGAAPLAEAMLRLGIVVRPMSAFGMPNGIRISVGTPQEHEKLSQALKTILVEVAR